MGICWYCYWGWAAECAAIHNEAVEELGKSAVDYGPGHIVFSDENFSNHDIDWCIAECDRQIAGTSATLLDDDVILRVKHYLKRMRAIPESVRDCQPEDYDDEHPENFPPSVKVVKQ